MPIAASHARLWLATRVSIHQEPELMEQLGQKRHLLAGSLSDLGRINRWFGGTRLTLWGLERLAGHLSPGGSLSVLDVASGGADIPEAEFRWARRRGLDAEVVASDLSLEILAQVPQKRRTVLRLVAADALRLPFADRSFDISTCSLVLHHFDPEDAVSLLGELHRVTRYGLVINDLVRSRHGYLGAWLVGRLFTRNPITRHDATLSVRRAYTRAEMKLLARRAGLGPVRFAGFLGYRVAMIAGGKP